MQGMIKKHASTLLSFVLSDLTFLLYGHKIPIS